ncbi:hypothetical protein BU14_0098s0060 [Porphyra umbilicalis]|uniref:Peptidase S1 domain-containing protein n=1 Tax=Porphyra umbilicalis TaxID=2786 RepID=A0A1X6PDC5_PORUM|nr:hypothetical protein BU14_0098s0060 [Porphyra umbilicalis]|eukprot:OSX78834.1 hypothetical protein BU14_0098s0060 [Porphyra umbilicalis]
MARGRMLTVLGAAAAAVAVAVAATAAAAQDASEAVIADSSRDRPLPVPRGRRRTRIVGGRKITEFDRDAGSQFMATLYTPDGFGYYCGGALVSFEHVLTRAGCFTRVGDVVRVGGSRLFQGVKLKVIGVTVHPNFNSNGDQNDIAVLKVSGPSEAVMVRKGAVPVIMRQTLGRPHGFYITGYGAVDKKARTAGSLQLKRGYQPRNTWAECKEIFKFLKLANGQALPINEAAQLCTNYKSTGSGALCERDVGGPQFRTRWVSKNGKWVKVYELYGITSFWVATRSEKCPQGFPNVSSSVPYYYNWIRSAMK